MMQAPWRKPLLAKYATLEHLNSDALASSTGGGRAARWHTCVSFGAGRPWSHAGARGACTHPAAGVRQQLLHCGSWQHWSGSGSARGARTEPDATSIEDPADVGVKAGRPGAGTARHEGAPAARAWLQRRSCMLPFTVTCVVHPCNVYGTSTSTTVSRLHLYSTVNRKTVQRCCNVQRE